MQASRQIISWFNTNIFLLPILSPSKQHTNTYSHEKKNEWFRYACISVMNVPVQVVFSCVYFVVVHLFFHFILFILSFVQFYFGIQFTIHSSQFGPQLVYMCAHCEYTEHFTCIHFHFISILCGIDRITEDKKKIYIVDPLLCFQFSWVRSFAALALQRDFWSSFFLYFYVHRFPLETKFAKCFDTIRYDTIDMLNEYVLKLPSFHIKLQTW